jgi:hypothetical protein
MTERWQQFRRAATEIGFIVFLFYANLLMGEFTRSSGHRSLGAAAWDVCTPMNFCIGFVAACIGHWVFESLRKRL